MSNPLFGMMGNNMGNLGNMAAMVKQFQQFKNSFRGDPKEQIQQMLNSGRITQAQYNEAVQMANALQQMLK